MDVDRRRASDAVLDAEPMHTRDVADLLTELDELRGRRARCGADGTHPS